MGSGMMAQRFCIVSRNETSSMICGSSRKGTDMFIAYVCDRVLAWKALADSTGKRAERDTSRHVTKRIKSGYTKYLGKSSFCWSVLFAKQFVTCRTDRDEGDHYRVPENGGARVRVL